MRITGRACPPGCERVSVAGMSAKRVKRRRTGIATTDTATRRLITCIAEQNRHLLTVLEGAEVRSDPDICAIGKIQDELTLPLKKRGAGVDGRASE